MMRGVFNQALRFGISEPAGLLYFSTVPTVYFDYNATTPLDPEVRLAMLPFLDETFANPSSIHRVGRAARAQLDLFRDRTAAVLRCQPGQVVFTSGGTEASNLAILGAARRGRDRGRHLITSSIEHHAVLHCFDYLERREGFAVTRLPVDASGLVNPADLRSSLRSDTILVSIMSANNETGAIQPVAELGSICRERGVLFHTDAVQSFGKVPFQSISQFRADLVSICSHKFHGPKGAGALYIHSPPILDPIVFGGGHEHELRAGTENLLAISGFVAAIERFVSPPVFSSSGVSELSSRLRLFLNSLPGITVVSPVLHCLPNTISFTASGSDSLALLAALDLEGFCASSGSACSSGSLNPSHVLLAMGLVPSLANSFVRLSLGRESSPDDVSSFISMLPSLLQRLHVR